MLHDRAAVRIGSSIGFSIGQRIGGLRGSISPIGSWDASTSTLAQLAALATHSRTSLATMFDSTGKLTYAPNNLALNTATLGTQSVTVQIGVNYLISFASGGGSIALSGAGAGTVTSASPVKITASTTTLTLTVTGTVTNAVVAAVTYETTPRAADQVITTAAAYYGPRFDYSYNGAAWVPAGLLVEGAATNLIVHSGDQSNASWSVLGGTVTPLAGAAPDGVSSAYTLALSGASLSGVRQLLSWTAGNTGTFTFYVRSSSSGGAANVRLTTNNSVAWSTGITTKLALTSQWQRITLSGALTSSGTQIFTIVGNANADGTVDATCAGNVDVAFAKLEAGAMATSYIPTAASSVTRAADVVQFTGAALTALQGGAATFIGQTIGLPFNPAANSALAAATAGNSVIAYVTNSDAVGVAAAATYNGAAALMVGMPNYATAMRIGSAFSGSGRSLVVNGGSVATDANAIGSRPAVYLGGTGASLYLNGWMQSFAIYNQRLPDATLQARSVVGASY